MKIISWEKAVEAYNRGEITRHELVFRIFSFLDGTNVEEFLDNADEDTRYAVYESLERQPHTDEDWGRILIAGSGWNPKDTPAAVAQMRKGVEALRKQLQKP